MSLWGWRVIALTLDYPHHAGGSGYGQLARRVAYDSVITPPAGPVARLYGRFAQATASNKIVKKFTRRKMGTEVRYLLRHGFGKRKIIHSFYGEHHSWLLRTLPKARGERRVMTVHLPPSMWHVSFKPGQIGKFDAVILMSHNQVEPLRKELGFAGKVEVIEHGVDTERFAFKEHVPTPEKIECVMVGNFLRDYQALAEIAKYCETAAPEIHFHVVANMESGAPIVGLPNVTHHRGISDEALVRLYQDSTIGLFTLADCTANNAVLEAMAAGLPIVVNDVGGIRTYVDESFGSFVAKDKPDEVVGVLRALVSDPVGYQERSRQARLKAESFGWDLIAKRTVALYEELIKS